MQLLKNRTGTGKLETAILDVLSGLRVTVELVYDNDGPVIGRN